MSAVSQGAVAAWQHANQRDFCGDISTTLPTSFFSYDRLEGGFAYVAVAVCEKGRGGERGRGITPFAGPLDCGINAGHILKYIFRE